MIRVHEIKEKCAKDRSSDLRRLAEKSLRLPPGSVTAVRIAKESIDAREKPVIYRVYSLDIESSLPDDFVADAARRNRYKCGPAKTEVYEPLACERKAELRPVVCGFGPCGIFASLVLARAGLRPIVLERGRRMDERVRDVERFWAGGSADPLSNVQFGEGGAGSFSDGKLTSGINDPAKSFVLETLALAGAPRDILYKQKPHIGTDVLRDVVVNIRNEIISLGGDVRFSSVLTDIDISGGKLRSVTVNGSGMIETDTLILAIGHSARDSFAMLLEKSLMLQQKQFSMGVRIEHPQRLIDEAQYGAPARELGISPAEYKLSCRTSSGRGVYTFCMCPGGEVVDSSCEDGACVTNGMSMRARSGEFANSALLCDVYTSDLGSDHPLAGAAFQERYEKLAYKAGGGRVPYWTLAQAFSGPGEEPPAGAGAEDHRQPAGSCRRASRAAAPLSSCLPGFVYDSLKEAIPVLARKLKGFGDPDSGIYAVESRSSSPVRIKRDACARALASDGSFIEGLYPAGEGAGYAGGIMSAAVDGIHAAERAMAAR